MNPPSEIAPEPAPGVERNGLERPSGRPSSNAPPPPLRLARRSPGRVTVGIRTKLIGLTFAAIFVIVGVLASYFPARQIEELRAELDERARVYAALASQQLRSAVAFGDQETAREVLRAIARDPLIDAAAIYDEHGTQLDCEGRPSELGKAARFGGASGAATYALPDRVLAISPVQSLEGPRGTVVIELSTRAAVQARDLLVRTGLLVGIVALFAGTLAAWLIARSLAVRVERVAEAVTAVADGDFQQIIELGPDNDEIGILARGFNAMVQQLRELLAHVRQTARDESERLERLVSKRTRELDRRNADLRLVLDSVEQGFVTIDRRGHVVGEHSSIVDQWLGLLPPRTNLWRHLGSTDSKVFARFRLGWAQAVEGALPHDVALAQMPKALRVGERELKVEYKPLDQGAELERTLVILTDITAVLLRERNDREERDVLAAASRLLKDRPAFLVVFAELSGRVERIMAGQSESLELKRNLHTLKGSSATVGLMGLASICHGLETELEGDAGLVLDVADLGGHWGRVREKILPLMGDQAAQIGIDVTEHEELLDAMKRGVPSQKLLQRVQAWKLESMRLRLSRFAEQLEGLATRLGKGPVDVKVESDRLYLAPEELSDFWTVMPHVLRNAVSHGLETLDRRQSLGKPAVAKLLLRAGVENDRLFIEVRDSGPGVDWEAVRARARAGGLPHATEAELRNALFVDGVSTRTDVDDMSGRGVGLAAVNEACQRRRGSIDVVSERGRGTYFRFSWPTSELPSLTIVEAGVAS